MRTIMLPAAAAISLVAPVSADAESVESRVARPEAQNEELRSAVERQEAALAEQQNALEGTPSRLNKIEEDIEEKRVAPEVASTVPWMKKIEIAGLIEIDASYFSPYEGDSESDVTLATVELGIDAQVNDWVNAGISFLYEQNETDLEVDVASITIANPDVTPLFLTAGQIYVPFGSYETNLISDPLPLEIGETRETAVQIGFATEGFSGSAYAFRGENEVKGKTQIGSWGAAIGYALEDGERVLAIGASYINDLGESDTLEEVTNENRVDALDARIEDGVGTTDFSVDPTNRVGGWSVNAAASLGRWNLIAEYLSAADTFDTNSLAFKEGGAQPSAWSLEAGYRLELMGRESIVAASYRSLSRKMSRRSGVVVQAVDLLL